MLSNDSIAPIRKETGPATSRPPAVLQVVPSLVSGGVERGTVDLAAALVEAGWTAYVASAGGPMEKELARVGADLWVRGLRELGGREVDDDCGPTRRQQALEHASAAADIEDRRESLPSDAIGDRPMDVPVDLPGPVRAARPPGVGVVVERRRLHRREATARLRCRSGAALATRSPRSGALVLYERPCCGA